MTISERKKEIRRRRKRTEKLAKLKTRLPKATKSEQVEMAQNPQYDSRRRSDHRELGFGVGGSVVG